jgi:hypothetical protein
MGSCTTFTQTRFQSLSHLRLLTDRRDQNEARFSMNFLFACDQPSREKRIEYTLFGFPLALDGNRYPLVTITQSLSEAPMTWRGLIAAFKLHGIVCRERNGTLDATVVIETGDARETVKSEGAFRRVLESIVSSRDPVVKVFLYVDKERK